MVRRRKGWACALALALMMAAVQVPLPAAAAVQGGDWLDEAAEIRQCMVVKNGTDSALKDVPVLVKVDSTNVPNREGMRFYLEDGTKLPYEVENWNPTGESSVWVKVPVLKASASTNIWGYYAQQAAANDAKQVWSSDYEVVEHFAALSEQTKDSTGQHTAQVVGEVATQDGALGTAAKLTGQQKLVYDAVGAGNTQLTASVVIDSEVFSDWAGLVCRDKNGGQKEGDTYYIGGYNGGVTARVYGADGSSNINTPVDKGTHLITMTYDGSTTKLYVDGALEAQQAKACGAILSEPATPLVLGAYSDDTGVVGGFTGMLDEFQFMNTAISEQMEAFRYANYLGDAVTELPAESKDGSLLLQVTSPADASTVETGLVTVEGIVNRAAELSYSLDGTHFTACGSVESGTFSVQIPLYALGAQTLTIQAVNKADAADSKTVALALTMQDTLAPQAPAMSQQVEGNKAVLSAQVTQADQEKVTAQFYQVESITLDAQNTKVYQGTTDASLPTAIKPNMAGQTQGEALFGTTVAENQTPYQIYQIALTDEQAQAKQFSLQWKGSAEREVSAYVYNQNSGQWNLLNTASGEGTLSMDLEIANTEGIVQNNQMYLLFWRGMNQPLAGRDSYIPTKGQYDFNLMWTTDTQFYSQNAADTHVMTTQFQWIIDQFEAQKSKLMVHTGDLVNVYNDRSQWENIDAAFKMIEAADIPYMAITGNHDSRDSEADLYQEYFPASRMQANNPYWGGNNGDEDYYYLMETNGAKFLVMGLGINVDADNIEWANNVLKAYPEHTVILLVHDYLTVGGEVEMDSSYANVRMVHDDLVAKNANIRIVLCGHNHGVNTNVETFADGHTVYSILSDYQSLSQGGLGFMRMLKFDVENNLLYVNTYSPYTGKTEYFTDKQAEKEGLYQKHKDEFVFQIDFHANTTRTLTTQSLTMHTQTSKAIGQPQELTGAGTVSVQWDGLEAGHGYAWYVTLTDQAGNTTTSEIQSFSTGVVWDALKQLMGQVENMDLSAYTDASVQALQHAWTAAQNLPADATQQQVDAAAQALQSAIDGLQRKTVDNGSSQQPGGNDPLPPKTGEHGTPWAWPLLLAGAGLLAVAAVVGYKRKQIQ